MRTKPSESMTSVGCEYVEARERALPRSREPSSWPAPALTFKPGDLPAEVVEVVG
jgi:hypothetical protein